MPAADEERDVGQRGHRPVALTAPQVDREEVTDEVIDPDDRKPAHERDGLGRLDPDEERADEPGPSRDGDRVDRAEASVHGGERLLDHRHHVDEVRARRELRHDAAVGSVHGGLARDDVGDDRPVLAHHGGGGLVARRLDAQDQHLSGPGG